MSNINTKGVHVDPLAEESVVRILAALFNDTAYMDPDVVKRNIELASDGGMSEKDRSIRAPLGNYLLARACLFYMGVVSNKEFRRMAVDAVAMEIALDDESPEFVAEARADMARDIREKPAKATYVMNLGKYDEDVHKSIAGMLSKSMERAAAFEDEMDGMIRKLSDDEQSEIGYVVSNFMYLFRAFSQNPTFTSCVKSTFKDVSDALSLQF